MLLQWGAKVDPRTDFGTTPLTQACINAHELGDVARILLQWGANTSERGPQGETLSQLASATGNSKLAKLLETPLGGRRCEVIGLKARSDLNGRTVVTTRYLPTKDRYAVEVELTGETVLIRPENLKRRDRTPKDMAGKIYVYHGKNEQGGNMISYNRFLGTPDDEEFIRQYEEKMRKTKPKK